MAGTKGVAVEEVEQAEEAGGVVLESKVPQTKKQRRKARGGEGKLVWQL